MWVRSRLGAVAIDGIGGALPIGPLAMLCRVGEFTDPGRVAASVVSEAL
jgi:hypothetical protein